MHLKNHLSFFIWIMGLLVNSFGVAASSNPLPQQTYQYQIGKITLNHGWATLTIPEDFKFLDTTQSVTIIKKLRPFYSGSKATYQGILFPIEDNPNDKDVCFVEISYYDTEITEEIAKSIDDQTYTDIEESFAVEKPDKWGYGTLIPIKWVTMPLHEEHKNIISWAKKYQNLDKSLNLIHCCFAQKHQKGILVMNIVGNPSRILMLQERLNKLHNSIDLHEGAISITDYNEVDKIATIGIVGLLVSKIAFKLGLITSISLLGKGVIWLKMGAILALLRQILVFIRRQIRKAKHKTFKSE